MLISACGTPASRSSSVQIRSAGWPAISSAAQPNSLSAPAFQVVTRAARSVAMMA
jgi:hypothetical protein